MYVIHGVDAAPITVIRSDRQVPPSQPSGGVWICRRIRDIGLIWDPGGVHFDQ